MKNQLLASSGTEEEIKKMISQFYLGSEVTLEEINPTKWSIKFSNGKGASRAFVELKKKRYRFVMLEEKK
jgi:hypothetical protein